METLKAGAINLDLLPPQWGLVACGKRKQPYQKRWQKSPLTKAEISTEISQGRCHAVGVLCGVPSGGLLFVDHDGPSCAELVRRLSGESVEDALPSTLVISSGRNGRAQYVYHVPEMFWSDIQTHKIPTGQQGDDGKAEQLEFRWSGCQSVVMGAHPSTAGYHWLHDADAITTAPLWMIEQMLKPSQTSPAARPAARPAAMTDGDWAREYLAAIPPAEDYDTWLQIGMALHSASADLLPEWESWSAGATNFEPDVCSKKWASFKRSGRGLGTLGYLAKKNGWHSVRDSVTISQTTSDAFKASNSKGFVDSVNVSVNSKGSISENGAEEALITDQEWTRFARAMTTPGSFDPFHWLPERLAKLARTDAARNCIDPMAIWAYLLPATLSLMGRDTWLDMSGWKEPNVAWSLLIGQSGSGKSRALDLVLAPLEKLNLREFENWKLRVEDWAAQERAKAKDKSDDVRPDPKPKCRRYLISQSTPEGIVKRLADQENNGVLAYRDEFAGFVKGLTQYSNGKGDGPEMLLETWGGKGLLVDRADEDKSFAVEATRLSLAGGIQPGIFAKTFETSEDAQGQLGRFLCVVLSEIPYKRYKGASLLPAELGRIYQFIDSTDWGTILPTEEADDLFTEVAENFKNQTAPTRNAQPWLLKLAGHTLRLAMAVHALECYYDRSKAPQTLTADTLARAYHMAQHYQRHFYYLMGASASDGLEGVLAKIQEAACCVGDGVTPRDIARGAAGSRVDRLARAEGMKPAAFCLQLFRELADGGWGTIQESVGPKGHKRISYHADKNHCSNSTDTLTESTQTLEHQGLRTVSHTLTESDSITDTTLKDTRNQGFQGFEDNQQFTDTISNGVESAEDMAPPIPVGAVVVLSYPRRENPASFQGYGCQGMIIAIHRTRDNWSCSVDVDGETITAWIGDLEELING